MIRLAEAVGRPVVSRASAEGIGELRHVVIDVPSVRVAALHVTGRRKRARLVDWSAVTGFGPDAIVVDREESVREPAEGYERGLASGDIAVLGALALSERGDALGSVDDLELDESSGAVEAVVVGETRIPASRLRAIGPYCVVLREA